MPLPSRETLLRYGLTEAQCDALFAPDAPPAAKPDPEVGPVSAAPALGFITRDDVPKMLLTPGPVLASPQPRPWVSITARVPDPAAVERRSGGNPIR